MYCNVLSKNPWALSNPRAKKSGVGTYMDKHVNAYRNPRITKNRVGAYLEQYSTTSPNQLLAPVKQCSCNEYFSTYMYHRPKGTYVYVRNILNKRPSRIMAHIRTRCKGDLNSCIVSDCIPYCDCAQTVNTCRGMVISLICSNSLNDFTLDDYEGYGVSIDIFFSLSGYIYI